MSKTHHVHNGRSGYRLKTGPVRSGHINTSLVITAVGLSQFIFQKWLQLRAAGHAWLRAQRHSAHIWCPARVGSISVHDTFGTKGGRFRYMSISVQTRSRSVHVNSAYATSVHRQYNFGTPSVQQEYDFGTRLRNKDADCHSRCCCKLWITSVSPKKNGRLRLKTQLHQFNN